MFIEFTLLVDEFGIELILEWDKGVANEMGQVEGSWIICSETLA